MILTLILLTTNIIKTYEDDYSYLIGKYKDVKNRKVDYDRYFVLATRYGQLSEKEYNEDDRPGIAILLLLLLFLMSTLQV